MAHVELSILNRYPLRGIGSSGMPRALRNALPALVNNFVELVKATALASAIAVGDITYQSIMIWTQRDNVLALMVVILLFFGLLTWLVSLTGRWLERDVYGFPVMAPRLAASPFADIGSIDPRRDGSARRTTRQPAPGVVAACGVLAAGALLWMFAPDSGSRAAHWDWHRRCRDASRDGGSGLPQCAVARARVLHDLCVSRSSSPHSARHCRFRTG